MPYRHLRRSDWASGDGWNGKLEGAKVGTGVSFLFNEVQGAGKGPPMHIHPYDELYLVRQGRAEVIVGTEEFEVVAGDILVIPAETPHKVVTAGDGRVEIVSVHVSATFEGVMLEGPEAPAP